MGLRRSRLTATAFAAAATCYAANCVLGTLVALRVVDTRPYRSVHHAIYIATMITTLTAMSSAFWGRPRARARRTALAVAPAVVPLAALPRAGTGTARHPIIALAAAPFLAAGVIRSH